MTVKEKIASLNAAFQKAYYDKDFGFFNYTIPSMLNEIKSFISEIITDNHPLRLKIDEHIKIIDYELKEMDDISKRVTEHNATKDNYLNSAKRNISQALWRFHDDIWRFDSKILEQVI